MSYFYYGEDQWGLEQTVKKMTAEFFNDQEINIIKFEGAELSFEKLQSEMITVGFFQTKKFIIIENLLQNKKKTEIDKIIPLLNIKNPDIYLILIEQQKPDKRSAYFKLLTKNCQSKEFLPPNQFELIKRIEALVLQNQSKISKEAAVQLAAMVPTDSIRLLEEIKKLCLFRFEQEIVKEDVVAMIVSENNPDIFTFVDNLARKNLNGAFLSLQKLLTAGLNENYILTMMVWQYRNLLIVRDLIDTGKSSVQQSGLTPYTYNKVHSLALKYRFKDLQRIYKLLEESDYEIKTGAREARPTLELLAARLAG